MGFSLEEKPIWKERAECADRDSNPGYQLGRLKYYHYTIGA